MILQPVSTLYDLPSELLLEISEQFPLCCRSSTLLSLALTCRRLQNAITPRLLYRDVCLLGETHIYTVTNMLLGDAEEALNHRGVPEGTSSLSLCVRNLSIDDSIQPTQTQNHLLRPLQDLINIGGLRYLRRLTLRAAHDDDRWANGHDQNTANDSPPIPPGFYLSLKERCPDLEDISLELFADRYNPNQWKGWIEAEIFTIKTLKTIRLTGLLHPDSIPRLNRDIKLFPPNLHTLDLRVKPSVAFHASGDMDARGSAGILNCVVPNLRIFIIDHIWITDPNSAPEFWRAHPRIEHLEIRPGVKISENSYLNFFTGGVLPNLKYLKCTPATARLILPYVSARLAGLSLLNTYNAQGAYLLRNVTAERYLPNLRSLCIEMIPRTKELLDIQMQSRGHALILSDTMLEERCWREDDNGITSVVEDPVVEGFLDRHFDDNYILSISKAAQNLEELELIGQCNNGIESIASALFRLPRLKRLGIFGSLRSSISFSTHAERSSMSIVHDVCDKKYCHTVFSEYAARILGNSCRTLEAVRLSDVTIDDNVFPGRLSVEFVRADDGEVVDIRRNQAIYGVGSE